MNRERKRGGRKNESMKERQKVVNHIKKTRNSEGDNGMWEGETIRGDKGWGERDNRREWREGRQVSRTVTGTNIDQVNAS